MGDTNAPGYVSVYLFFFCMLASACGNFKGQKWKHTRMYDTFESMKQEMPN